MARLATNLRKQSTLWLGAAIVGVVVVLLRLTPSGSRLMTVELIGTEGFRVQGTYTADGVERTFAGVLPTSITVEAKRLDYSIWMSEEGGELEGRLRVAE